MTTFNARWWRHLYLTPHLRWFFSIITTWFSLINTLSICQETFSHAVLMWFFSNQKILLRDDDLHPCELPLRAYYLCQNISGFDSMCKNAEQTYTSYRETHLELYRTLVLLSFAVCISTHYILLSVDITKAWQFWYSYSDTLVKLLKTKIYCVLYAQSR